MMRRRQLALVLGCVLLAMGGLVLLWFKTATKPAVTSIPWTVQPDHFPLGTVLQGSRVDVTLGLFGQLKPTGSPAFVNGLPSRLRNAAEAVLQVFRDTAIKLTLRVRVEAPDFVSITRNEVRARGTDGALALVSLRLKTDKPAEYRGDLVVHLSGGPYGVTNIVVPLTAKVLGDGASNLRSVLITSSPYQEYATGNGSDLEPLAGLNSRLSEQGIRINFCRTLPRKLSDYRTILLADSEMAQLGRAETERLKSFVAEGGRLILAANAFFVPTVPSANRLLESYGLQIVDQDAGQAVTNSQVVSDILTSRVNHVDFWRPSIINVTDPSQAKILVKTEDDQGGFVAVSRQPSRGEVIVLTQSLWWSWIRSEPAKADNRLLLENLLAH